MNKFKRSLNKQIWFRRAFLGVTATSVAMELFAVFGPDWAEPWCTHITKHVPPDVAAAFALWLPVHLHRTYRRHNGKALH